MAGTRGAYVLETDCADRYHGQVRLQVCTLARLDSAQTETTALLQQVLTMLQQGAVRQRSRTLSIHPQVEPADFNSQTTKVGHHPRLWIHTNGYHSQVVANTTTSTVTFSILSPDASLSYDRIKLRLEDYRALLASASDTIELSTENGRTVICRKQANEMEEYLDKAEILLRDVIQSRGISTLVALHHLCRATRVEIPRDWITSRNNISALSRYSSISFACFRQITVLPFSVESSIVSEAEARRAR